MLVYPFLDLSTIELDANLVRRLPRRIAYYHLALPIAEDQDGITVALVHPDSQRALDLLKTYLGETIIPVQASSEVIRSKLDSIWQGAAPAPQKRFVCWVKQGQQQEAFGAYAQDLLRTFDERAQVDFRQDLPGDLRDAGAADFILAISPDEAAVEKLFRFACTILLLYRLDIVPNTILQVLRGHTPDYHALDWIIPLTRRYDSSVRLLAGIESQRHHSLRPSIADLLASNTEKRYHMDVCRQILAGAGVQGQLKIRQEPLEEAVRHELEARPFSLVAIAAEAHGDFAQQVWRAVNARTAGFLVVKP